MNIFRCKNCLNISTRPRITFDEKGWCNACQWVKEKKSISKIKKVFEHTTRVEISKLLNPPSNLVTLETLDQPALLSQVAYIFYENGINVISSRITTLDEKVEDNFLVMDARKNSAMSVNKEKIISKKLKNL